MTRSWRLFSEGSITVYSRKIFTFKLQLVQSLQLSPHFTPWNVVRAGVRDHLKFDSKDFSTISTYSAFTSISSFDLLYIHNILRVICWSTRTKSPLVLLPTGKVLFRDGNANYSKVCQLEFLISTKDCQLELSILKKDCQLEQNISRKGMPTRAQYFKERLPTRAKYLKKRNAN